MPIINLVSNIVCLFGVMLLYEGSSKKRAAVTILAYSINAGCDLLAIYLFMDYHAGEPTSQLFSIVTDLLILICELIAERILGEQGRQEYVKKLSGIIAIPILGIMMQFFLLTANIGNRNLMIWESIGILGINVIVFYLYHTLVDMHQKLYEKEILEQQVKIYVNQLEVIDQS